MSNDIHGCGDQSGFDDFVKTLRGVRGSAVIVYYDGPLDCFWLIGNGSKLRLPSSIRLDRGDCGTSVVGVP